MKNWYEIYKNTIIEALSKEEIAKTIKKAAQKITENKNNALKQIKT